jgi:anti-anti-sigma factor
MDATWLWSLGALSRGSKEVAAVFESRLECRAERRSFGGVVICVAGEIDLLTAPVLESVLDQLNGSSQGCTVEVDLADVVFLSARGISALVVAARSAARKRVDFRVTGCRRSVRRVIDIAGLAALLGLSPDGAAS